MRARSGVGPTAALLLAAAVVSGCTGDLDGLVTPTTASVPPVAPPTAASRPAAPISERLDRLTVAPEGPREGYDRDRFPHWVDEDGDGCDTRCEVLGAERQPVLAGLPGGGWRSLYDGDRTDDAADLEIDHVVALAEAWDSGASGWDETRRRAFANDLDLPGALIAVTAATNRSKSDRDPASWQPPSREGWCEFGAAWIDTKLKWGLTADPAEVAALANVVAGC